MGIPLLFPFPSLCLYNYMIGWQDTGWSARVSYIYIVHNFATCIYGYVYTHKAWWLAYLVRTENAELKVPSAAAVVVLECEALWLFNGLSSYVLVAGEVSSSALMVIHSLLTYTCT